MSNARNDRIDLIVTDRIRQLGIGIDLFSTITTISTTGILDVIIAAIFHVADVVFVFVVVSVVLVLTSTDAPCAKNLGHN